MNPAQLLFHFDRISETPDAIPRLRRFILDLAVQGKLLEQGPRDEPALELLRRVHAEKARLVHVGKIKKEKPLPAIEEDEIPFAIPAIWRWVRLNDITSYIQRGKSPKYATGEGLPVISQKCVQWGGLELESAKLITRESIEDYEPIRFLRSDDLLWNSTGTGTIGRIIKVKEPLPKLVCDSHVTVVRCLEVDAEYVRSWLRSDHVYAVIEDRAAGSTNQVELTSQLAKNQVVPLPPLAEQHRIVAKVDELMALCDRLESAQAEQESRRDRLVASSVNRLNNGVDADAFREHARFYFDLLPRLTTRQEHIRQLRQTIRSLAVRGKLVPQDPNDEPASELLKRIHRTRKHLRKFASLDLDELESPLPEIPSSWTWTVVDQIAGDDPNSITDGPFGANLKTEHYVTTPGCRVIRLQNIGRGLFHEEHCSYIDRSRFDRLTKHHVHPGDLVVAGLVHPFVRCCELPANFGPALVKADCYRFSVHTQACARFASHYLNSPTAQEFAAAHHHGMTLTRIGLGNFRRIPFPLPPLAEQHRIVAKVEELMALCDRLERQLTTTQTESRRLLEATLHYALSA